MILFYAPGWRSEPPPAKGWSHHSPSSAGSGDALGKMSPPSMAKSRRVTSCLSSSLREGAVAVGAPQRADAAEQGCSPHPWRNAKYRLGSGGGRSGEEKGRRARKTSFWVTFHHHGNFLETVQDLSS